MELPQYQARLRVAILWLLKNLCPFLFLVICGAKDNKVSRISDSHYILELNELRKMNKRITQLYKPLFWPFLGYRIYTNE